MEIQETQSESPTETSPVDEKYQAYLRAKSRVYHAKKHAQEHGIPTLNQIANSSWGAFDALGLAIRRAPPTTFQPVDDDEFDNVVYKNNAANVKSFPKTLLGQKDTVERESLLQIIPWRQVAPILIILGLLIFQTRFSFEASIAESPLQSVSLLFNGIVGPWFPSLLEEIDIVKKIPNNAVIVDVRSTQKVQPIPGSLHIPLQHLPHQLDLLQDARFNAQPVLITCLQGLERECVQAAIILRDAEFVRVAILDGGIKKWHRDEL
jgi:rhodanese-related sulfurtransferase